MQQPRQHHYVFAHIALRSMFLSDPQRFMAQLKTRGEMFLRQIWERVGVDVNAAAVVPPTGLRLTLETGADDLLALIRCPKAEVMAEAILVGCHLPRITSGSEAEGGPFPRFFTLEYGHHDDGSLRTVLCEWQKPERHLNFGDGPPAEEAAFAAAIRAKVNGDA